MLLSTYARRLKSSGDWGEMEKLQNAPGMAQAPKCAARNPLIGKVIDLHS